VIGRHSVVIEVKKSACKMSTSICLDRPAGGHQIRGRMEDHMNNLFSAHWTGRKAGGREADWSHLPPSGFGRLLAAVVITGIAVCLLDHAAGKGSADTAVASSYESTQEWR
jgi:hypothetical protein